MNQKKNSSSSDFDRHFRTDHLNVDLRRRSIRGGAVTLATQACIFLLNLGSTLVLARILTPSDFGLIGMVIAVTGFVALFKDLGLSVATIQREEINHEQISTLFWINVALSCAILIVTAALAPAIAWFYSEPRLSSITLVLAGTFIFGGLTVQHQALLRRQMRFTHLAAIEITAMVVGITTAILSALQGAGYWSLVLMQLAREIATSIGVWIMCSWRPGFSIRYSGVRSMLTFGGNLTGFNVINYLARNLDNVLIGRYLGSGQLGLYSKSYQLLLLPLTQINHPISSVVIPSLSRLQKDLQRFRRYYLNALSAVTSLTIPIAILVIVLSEEIVQIVLGPQWHEATLILRLLAISALVQPICNTAGWLYISTGRTLTMFKWGLFASTIIGISFIIGLPYGAPGVALCYSIAILLLSWPCMHYAIRGTPTSMIDILYSIKKPFLASLLAGCACFLTKRIIEPIIPLWISAMICLVMMVSIYSIVLFYLFDTKGFYFSILKEIKL